MWLTVPRLLILSLWIFCGAILGLTLLNPWGRLGLFVGCIVGFVGAMFATWAITMAYFWLFPLPVCRQGKCSRLGRDFVWRQGKILGYEGKGKYLYKCRCGDHYVRQGNKFMYLAADSTTRPYQQLVAIRKWADDSK